MLKSAHRLLAVAAVGAATSAVACTSWIIHPSVSASGRMLVHKCRDNRPDRLDANIRVTRHGVRWMQLGATRGPLFAVNEHGVATVMNDGDPMTLTHPGDSKQSPCPRLKGSCSSLALQVMDECTTAEQAAKLALHYGRNLIKAAHGNSILVADAKRAFFIDFGPGYTEVQELTQGFCMITNCMHLPGIESYSKRSVGALRGDRAREANVRASLKKHRVDGKYTIQGVIETARTRCQQDYSGKYPCRRNSISAVCFEIDPEFPAQLTTAYVALGPQQHTVFLPTPMALKQFPEEIRKSSWADLAYALRKNAGFDHKYLPRFKAFETQAMTEYCRVREEARRMLKAGQKAEAVKALNDCYDRQFAAALKLLKEVDADVAANPPATRIEAGT